jgi:hypothetical protein
MILHNFPRFLLKVVLLFCRNFATEIKKIRNVNG